MHIHLGRANGQLQSIELNKVTHHKALPHLDKLLANNQTNGLNKVYIEDSILNDDDFFALENIFNHCGELNEIKLNSNHIDDQHAHELFSALPENKLQSIGFTDNWIGENISNDFFDFMKKQKKITSLDFSLNWLGDKGIIKLLKSIGYSIEKLNLSCNDFHLDGMAAICNYAVNSPHLSDLDISYNFLDDKAAKKIAFIINKNKCIATIKINSNQIGDKGARLIAEALQHNVNPIQLDLSDNQISDEGARFLIESAFVDGTYRHLNLKFNPINKEKLSKIIRTKKEQYPLIEILC